MQASAAEPAPPAAEAATQEAAARMDVESGNSQQQQQPQQSSRRSSSNSSPEEGASVNQLRRTVKQLREEVDEAQDEQALLRRQLLWQMSQEVRRQRKEMSCQVVVQGWRTDAENTNVWEAHKARDQFLLDMLTRATRLHRDQLAFEASHSTNLDSLSKISILTHIPQHSHHGSGAAGHSSAALPVRSSITTSEETD